MGRTLDLQVTPGARFSAEIDIDTGVADAAAVTDLIGTYPEAIERAEIDIGGSLRLILSNPATTKITKRVADPYAWLLEAEIVSPDGPAVARGNFEVVLQRRSEHAPADDVDDLGPPVVRNYVQRIWRIWLILNGAPPSKIEGVLTD